MIGITNFYFIFFYLSIGHAHSPYPIIDILENHRNLLKLEAEVSYSDTSKTLQIQVEQLEVAYTVWGCSCPNWIRVSDLHQQENESSLFIDYHFYLESADSALEIPDDFDPFQHKLILEGQFYEKEGLPEGWHVGEEPLRLAKVFRYTKLKMMPLDKKR